LAAAESDLAVSFKGTPDRTDFLLSNDQLHIALYIHVTEIEDGLDKKMD